MENVSHVVIVLSGKGGVGKSSVVAKLSQQFAKKYARVAILDCDLCGPCIPRMFGLNDVQNRKVEQGESGWKPVEIILKKSTLSVLSIDCLLEDENAAVIWRGPKKSAMIRQFLESVEWGQQDVMVVDTPPGTSDEHISLIEYLKSLQIKKGFKFTLGAILVTTPQGMSVDDVRRSVTFCKKTGLRMLGVIENMSGFECSHCHHTENIFSSQGGEMISEISGVKLLGSIPLSPKFFSFTTSDVSVDNEDLDQSIVNIVNKIELS